MAEAKASKEAKVNKEAVAREPGQALELAPALLASKVKVKQQVLELELAPALGLGQEEVHHPLRPLQFRTRRPLQAPLQVNRLPLLLPLPTILYASVAAITQLTQQCKAPAPAIRNHAGAAMKTITCIFVLAAAGICRKLAVVAETLAHKVQVQAPAPASVRAMVTMALVSALVLALVPARQAQAFKVVAVTRLALDFALTTTNYMQGSFSTPRAV